MKRAVCLAALMCAAIAQAGDRPAWFRFAILRAAAAGGSAFDWNTSRGMYELNPALQDSRGMFNARRAAGIKICVSAGITVAAALITRKYPRYQKAFDAFSIVEAGAYTASGARNMYVRRR